MWDTFFTPTAFLRDVSGVLLCVAVLLTLWMRPKAKEKVSFPVVGSIQVKDYRPILEEGVKECCDSPFVIPTSMHDIIVLPLSAAEEIKRLPESQISLRFETLIAVNRQRINASLQKTPL